MIVLGHRGARAHARDNSTDAFRKALAAGAAGTELDVRRSLDGMLVCVHDATIEVGGTPARVCETRFDELRRAGVTTLDEALAVLAGSEVVVEIKNSPWDECHDASYALAAAVAERVPDGTIVGCFDPETLAHVRDARPDVRTAVITSAGIDPLSNLDAAVNGGHEICSVEEVVLSQEFVASAHAAGRRVYAWATDEPERVRVLASFGVDALMCDDPGRAIAALREG